MTASQSSQASIDRPLPMRMRPDLVAQPLGDGRTWSLKDPLSLRYWQLAGEEYFILRQLNGSASLNDLQRKFAREYAPRRITPDQLQLYLGSLFDEGLIYSQSTGQGVELAARRKRVIRQERLAKLGSILAWRFRGVDPEQLLKRIAPWTNWIFRWPAIAAYMGLVVSAILLVTWKWQTVLERSPEWTSFFDVRSAFLLIVAASLAKILHELAHAIFCKHFGGECHEIGLMLLFGTPCLYCNVSDSWMLRSKWQRAAIGAAGMLAEVGLAAVATWLWWFSQPGLFNSLCFDLLLVCSVNTVFLNGNPLLQYDGYYILADLTETPNLRQQANLVVRQWLAKFWLGLDLTPERKLRERGRVWLALFSVASAVYRWFVVLTLLWIANQFFKRYDLQLFSWLLGAIFLATLVVLPLWKTLMFLRHPSRSLQVRWNRVLGRGIPILLVLVALAMIPLPFHPTAPAVIELRDEAMVFVATAGNIIDAVPAGSRVQAGDRLATLQNLEIERDVRKLQGELSEKAVHLKNLRLRQGDPEAASAIPTAEKSLEDAQERLRQRQRDQSALEIKAPRTGTVIPPTRRVAEPGQSEAGGGDWTGDPLEPRNRNSVLTSGTHLCSIGDPAQVDAVLLIDQADIRFISEGQTVQVLLDQYPALAVQGTIRELSEVDTLHVPPELLAHEDLPVRTDESGKKTPTGVLYQARVALEPTTLPLLVGSSGRAKIDAKPQSAAARLQRYLQRTFRFDW
ncbi:MAG: HlyD family efflux transporter periplasmic adaptor subunit [Planctomycetota bacterium]|nr:HlyD family efflux transporter periplasmic adaptor subunit [Planctomycetota bacterium]